MSMERKAKEFLEFLEKNKAVKINKESDKEICFVISPVGENEWSFWMVTCAILCERFKDVSIRFLVIDCWQEEKFILPYYSKYISVISEFMKYVRDKYNYQVDFLSDYLEGEYDQEILDEATKSSVIRFLGTSNRTPGYYKAYNRWNLELKNMIAKLYDFFQKNHIKTVAIVAATVWESYPVYLYCRKYMVDVLCFDDRIIFEKNSVSVTLSHMTESYNNIRKNSNMEQLRKDALKIMKSRMRGKIASNDPFKIELQSTEWKKEKYDYVIFPNCEFDGAALRTHVVFEDDYEWLISTTKYILENTDKTVAVRQHPFLRTYMYQADYLEDMLKQFSDNPRFKLYSCLMEVNSYDLIRDAGMVIVNTSTIAMEAAYLGKKVITESKCLYSDSDFVTYCSTKEEYFKEIDNFNRNFELEKKKRERALEYYGLRQLCGTISYEFSEGGFDLWSKQTFEDIYINEETKALIDCICNDKKMLEEKYALLYGRRYEY